MEQELTLQRSWQDNYEKKKKEYCDNKEVPVDWGKKKKKHLSHAHTPTRNFKVSANRRRMGDWQGQDRFSQNLR